MNQTATNYLVYYLVAAITLVAVITSGINLYQRTSALNQKRSDINRLQHDLDQLDRIITVQATHQSQLAAITTSVPTTYREVAHVFQLLESLASDHDQEIEISPTETANSQPQGLDALALTINTTGNYADLANFLSSLSQLPYHIRLDSIQIDSNDSGVASLISLRLFIIGNSK